MRASSVSGSDGRDNRRGTLHAFTLIELLVVIAVVILLVGLLLPALGSARAQAKAMVCATRLQQLGIGLGLYFNEFDNTLPQVRIDVGGGFTTNIGALFGGKKGTLPHYGIDEYGAERRPLNRYIITTGIVPDDAEGVQEVEAFKSPADKGGEVPGVGFAPSMYDLLGTSYTLNDHTLEGEANTTLIPPEGGRMPYVVAPTKTWVLGTHTIYNYQENGDRMHWWFQGKQMRANLLFLDMHVGPLLVVPVGVVNTTNDYTFQPTPSR